ncbi:hypothetical protein M5689_008595 [Euphorbia peplus]|nr:hypothetical protein M5689_008595 [Euphorbia peplus]
MGFHEIIEILTQKKYNGYKMLEVMPEMGFKPTSIRRRRNRRKTKQMWLKKINGGIKGIRLSSSKKLSLTVLIFGSRISKIYGEIVSRIKEMYLEDDIYFPRIIFSTQLGLPVLSHHSSVTCRTRRRTTRYVC